MKLERHNLYKMNLKKSFCWVFLLSYSSPVNHGLYHFRPTVWPWLTERNKYPSLLHYFGRIIFACQFCETYVERNLRQGVESRGARQSNACYSVRTLKPSVTETYSDWCNFPARGNTQHSTENSRPTPCVLLHSACSCFWQKLFTRKPFMILCFKSLNL